MEETVRKVSIIISFLLFGMAVGIAGSVELNSIEFHLGMRIAFLCLCGAGFTSWLGGLWYHV